MADVESAHWITTPEDGADKENTWIAYRRDINLRKTPKEAVATIAADSKYWLWINGQLAVFEGGLKRGPSPTGSYYDKVDLAPYLRKGENKIAVLLWHFGKSGFSHTDSGRAGLFMSVDNGGNTLLVSDSLWRCRLHPAYGTTGKPVPNWRLSEANIRFDAAKDMPGWQTAQEEKLEGFAQARQTGRWGDAPWNAMTERPIPQWKDYGVKKAAFRLGQGTEADTAEVRLPYNMQMTPVFTVNDPEGGHTVAISTDHSYAGSQHNIRAEYVTKKGRQTYESYGWMNGEHIYLVMPKGVTVESVAYRETGYDTDFKGSFSCSDDFLNRFWKKATRTLYVNMRDNFFDCPDRERAQWWGDMVLLMGESFYTLSPSVNAMMRKALHELAAWQKPDGVLYGPIPGNYDAELPAQILATVGRYGLWNYYMNTGDTQTIRDVYPAVRKYMALWQLDDNGLTVLRKGGWLWGDWGTNRDMRLIQAGWHYIALDGAERMARLTGNDADAESYRNQMERLKAGFNKCWNGQAYCDPQYHKETDDRVQALAVISGIADEEKYPRLTETLRSQWHASPYMEKYVMEALCMMGEHEFALERTRKRFAEMVNDTAHTTLYEGWGIGRRGYGGGTTNHAWSGGAQIVLTEHVLGIRPLEPMYRTFLIEPHTAGLKSAAISIPTVSGMISSAFECGDNSAAMTVDVPRGTKAVLRLPENASVTINGKEPAARMAKAATGWERAGYAAFGLTAGRYDVRFTKKQ